MGLFRKESAWDKVAKPLSRVSGHQAARSGLTAGVALIAVSVASAVTSAVRRREDQG